MMNSDFFKGIATGAIFGAAMGMLFDPTRSAKDTHILKKKAGRLVKAAGNIIENMTDM